MTLQRAAVAVVLLTIAPVLSAFQAKPVDATGAWVGTFTTGNEKNEAHLTLTQKGTELTGSGGPSVDQQMPLAKGRITTEKDVTSLTFEVTEPGGLLIRFDLKLVDGRLKGTATAEANGEKREAAIDLGRAK